MSAAIPHIPVERFELACGALLLVSPRPGAPVSAIQAHIRGGHSIDPDGKEGLSFFTGRLTDQGTASYDEEEFAAKLELAGGSLSGGTTGVGGTMAGDSWKLLVELFAEALTAPEYPKEPFERERRRILERLEIERDDPRAQCGLRFRALVYGDHFLGRPESGSVESVAKLRRADLSRHHARNWCASRTVIAFCGDVDPKTVARTVDRRLKGWKTGKPLPSAPQEFPARERRLDVFTAERQQVHLSLGHLGIRRNHPDYAALVVMDHVLGTGPGFTNRIARILRDEQGLAYTVHAAIHNSAGVFPGAFSAYIGTSPEHLRTALAGFVQEIERIQREPVEREELELAKSYLTGSFALGFERASRRVNAMISAYRNDLPDDYIKRLLHDIQAVEVEDVQRVASEHLFPRESCLVAAGPVDRAELAAAAAAVFDDAPPARKRASSRKPKAAKKRKRAARKG